MLWDYNSYQKCVSKVFVEENQNKYQIAAISRSNLALWTVLKQSWESEGCKRKRVTLVQFYLCPL